jgi:hypothetical protein
VQRQFHLPFLPYLGVYLLQLNLFLAVLKTKFAKAKNLLDDKRRQRRAMRNGRNSKKGNVLAKAAGWMKSESWIQQLPQQQYQQHQQWWWWWCMACSQRKFPTPCLPGGCTPELSTPKHAMPCTC